MYNNISNKMEYRGGESEIVKFFKNLEIEFIVEDKGCALGSTKHEIVFDKRQFEENKHLWFKDIKDKEVQAKKGKHSVIINLDFKNLEECFLYDSGRCANKIELIRLLIELEEQQNDSIIELYSI